MVRPATTTRAHQTLRVFVAVLIATFAFRPAAHVSAAAYPACTVVGTAATETLRGTIGADVICTGGGDDIVDAGGGSDIVLAQGGRVTAHLGEGDDRFDGTGAVRVKVSGEGGNDVILGSDGDDDLDGGPGTDTIVGDSGDDSLDGGDGADDLAGGPGDDYILGDSGEDSIEGGDGNDELSGGNGDDAIFGEVGDDFLSGGDGDDTLDGGSGSNLCNAETGGGYLPGCTFDDERPNILSIAFAAPSVEVGDSSDSVMVTVVLDDRSPLQHLEVRCDMYGWQNSSPAIVQINRHIYGVRGYHMHTYNGGFSEEVALDPDIVREGTAYRVRLPLIFRRGSLPGDYRCRVTAVDFFGNNTTHLSADGTMPEVPTMRVLRSTGGWDDEAPALQSIDFDKQSVDVTDGDAAIGVAVHVSDATRVDSVSLYCYNPMDASATMTQGGIWFRSQLGTAKYYKGYANPLFTSVPVLAETSGSPGDLTVSFELVVARGTVAGRMVCGLGLSDAGGHWVHSANRNWTGPKIPGLIVERRGSGWDDAAPHLISLTFDREVADISMGDATLMAAIEIEDATSIRSGVLWCHPADGGESIAYASFSEVVAGPDGGYQASDVYNRVPGPTQAAFGGSKTRLSVRLPITFRGSSQPGRSECQFEASDGLSHSAQFDLPDQWVNRLPAPRSIVAKGISSTMLDLSWAAPFHNGGAEIVDYDVEVSRDQGRSWDTVPHLPSTVRGMKVSGLAKGTSYLFRVAAVNRNGEGTFSQPTSATTLTTVPGAPTALMATAVTTSSATLRWAHPADRGGLAITDYFVETSRDGGATWRLVPHARLTSSTLNLTGLAPGTRYLVRVAAKNDLGTGASAFGVLTTASRAATAPRDLHVRNLLPWSLTLTWALPASNGGSAIVDYRIQVSTNGGSSWKTLTHAASNLRTFQVRGLQPETEYLFRVAAVNASGVGSYANLASVTTPSAAP